MLWNERLITERRGDGGLTSAALLAPSPELTPCVRAYVTRCTVGAALSAQERMNHFPAVPTCAITWFVHGDYAHKGADGEPMMGELPHPVMLTGPHTRPRVSVNSGAVDVFILLLLPDALHALTGLDIAALVDRYYRPADVMNADWSAMVQAVQQAADHSARIEIVEGFLLPRWQALAVNTEQRNAAFQQWTRSVTKRAERHAAGRSERQIDRRIKDWTGLSLRQLLGIGRGESTALHARDAWAANALSWAEIAARLGFSDQAHLSREFRRITGLSPRQLKYLLTHESGWMYQIWA